LIISISLVVVHRRIVFNCIAALGIVGPNIVMTIVVMFLVPTISPIVVKICIVVVDAIRVIVRVYAVAAVDVSARRQHGRHRRRRRRRRDDG
jgi:hypothetical protein